MTDKQLKPIFYNGKTSSELDNEGKGISDEFMREQRKKLRVKNNLEED
jgi:hypothetical protein